MQHQGGLTVQVDGRGVVQQGGTAHGSEFRTKKKVAIAMHDEQRDTAVTQGSHAADRLHVFRQHHVITQPGLKQIAQTRLVVQKTDEQRGDVRPFGTEM